MKGADTLEPRLYTIGQFARRAGVTLRTLRHYDRIGLLAPARHSPAGYRLYAEDDLLALQQILALKFLGLSLQEIRLCLERGPRQMVPVLARQKELMQRRRAQIDNVVRAIERAQALLAAGEPEGDAIVRVIEVIQMERDAEWVKGYFTDEQRQTMEELSRAAYSDEARRTLQARGTPWTEEDQRRADADWRYVAAEANRLAAAGADPAGDEAQALARFKNDLLGAFTGGDPEVAAGVARFWEGFHALPAERQPFDASAYTPDDAGAQLLEKAMGIYRERGGAG